MIWFRADADHGPANRPLKKRLAKKAKRGFRGYPVGTLPDPQFGLDSYAVGHYSIVLRSSVPGRSVLENPK